MYPYCIIRYTSLTFSEPTLKVSLLIQSGHFMAFEEINVISKAKDTLPIPRKEPLHALYELYFQIEEKQNRNVSVKTMAEVLRKDIRSVRRLYSGLAQKGYVSMLRVGNETRLDLLVDITATEVWNEEDDQLAGFEDFKIKYVRWRVVEAKELNSTESLTELGIRNFGKSLMAVPLYQTKPSKQFKTALTYSHYLTLKDHLIKCVASDTTDCIDDYHPLATRVWERAAKAVADDTLKLMKTQGILKSVQVTGKVLRHLGIHKEGCVLIDTRRLMSKYPQSCFKPNSIQKI